MLAFVAMLAANEWLFTRLEFVPGINWIYLPAGMRLLCVLLFGNAGAHRPAAGVLAGLLLLFFPGRLPALVHGRHAGRRRALDRQPHRAAGVRPARFADQPVARAACWSASSLYSIASPLLHHIWFAVHGGTEDLLHGFFVMFIGDLNGTLIVVYAMKGLLAAAAGAAPKPDAAGLAERRARSSRSSHRAPPDLRRPRRPP